MRNSDNELQSEQDWYSQMYPSYSDAEASANVMLSPSTIAIEEAEVVGARRTNSAEAPLSVRSLGTNEIKRNPGGGRDISRAIRTLPGVAAIPSFRNDIVIRGGAPNENRFYIDGIEIPNINHFATQGASGGPVGMINVDLVLRINNQWKYFYTVNRL